MNSEDNSIPSKIMESDTIKELYKKTPLKKRPIQPSSLSPDEKRISPKPRACTVPEGRLSKRKMLKPTKKRIDSYIESTTALEQAPKAMYVPVIKTSAEAKDSFPVEMNHKAVNMAMAMAIPELKKTTCEETEVPSRFPKSSKALCKKNFTAQEWEDFNLAIAIQNSICEKEFNLRERHPRRSSANVRTKLKCKRSPVKIEETSVGSIDSYSISSPEMPNDADEKQGKQEVKRIPKAPDVKIEEDKNHTFTGSHSQNMYILSPELANIIGQKKMSSSAIIDAMHYVFLERNLFVESDRKLVHCDDELAEKIFSGRRHLQFDEVRSLLRNHLTLTD